MKKYLFTLLFCGTLGAIATSGTAVDGKTDTVGARCNIYPAGQDRSTSSSLCTFSQPLGAVGIQLQNGRRYDLRPVGNQPANYVDQNGRAVRRDGTGLGNRGIIFRFPMNPSTSTGTPTPTAAIPWHLYRPVARLHLQPPLAQRARRLPLSAPT